MEKRNVQLLLSEEEYKEIEIRANRVGLTVPLFIKSEILKSDDFGTVYQKLISKVEELPSGTEFNIRSLFGVEWTMSRGIKLNLGKTYYSRVNSGVITNVTIVGTDSSNVMVYRKK